MADGWISLHRKIEECWLWLDEPFSKGQAWVDLLLMANHHDKQISFNGEIITVSAGSRITSILYLSERWQWSRHKVSNFLNLLEKDKMITQKRDNKKTLITVVNYELYQCGIENGDIKRTSKGHQKDTNNNDNKEINISIVQKDGLDKSFKELLDHYASFSHNRNGSTRAKQKYKLLCTKGCVIGGEFVKLTPEEVDRAVGNYVNDMETRRERGEWVPEWRNISTILNNITEYMGDDK